MYSETLALKPWLLYQITRLLTITKMIFFVESSAISYCPVCGEPLSYRDSCERIMRLEGGGRRRFLIRRLKCSNCGKLHRELPDCLVPYKHYASEVISGVLDGIISPDDKDTVWWDSPRNFWDPGCRCSISCEVHSRNGWKHCSGFFIIPEVFLSPFNIPVLHRLCFAVTTALWYPPCKGGYD